jgi:hypothetical protein
VCSWSCSGQNGVSRSSVIIVYSRLLYAHARACARVRECACIAVEILHCKVFYPWNWADGLQSFKNRHCHFLSPQCGTADAEIYNPTGGSPGLWKVSSF